MCSKVFYCSIPTITISGSIPNAVVIASIMNVFAHSIYIIACALHFCSFNNVSIIPSVNVFQVKLFSYWTFCHFWRPICQTIWNGVITHNVIWANQKAKSFVYHWLPTHAMFDARCFAAYVRAPDIISSVVFICLFNKFCHSSQWTFLYFIWEAQLCKHNKLQ